MRADRLQEGIEQFEITLKLKPGYSQVLVNLGAALGKAGRLDEAVVQLQEAVRRNPDSLDAYANLAKAYQLLGQPAAAVAAAEQALVLAQVSGNPTVAGQIESWLKAHRAEQPNERDESSPSRGGSANP